MKAETGDKGKKLSLQSSEEPLYRDANGMCYELTFLHLQCAPSSPLHKINLEGKDTFLDSKYF